MIVGVPAETKTLERRVAMTPAGVAEVVADGHEVVIEKGAGEGSGLGDDEFVAAGAQIVADVAELYDRARLVVHVKEPQPRDLELLRPHHTLFTYLHLAAYPEVAEALIETGATAIAYETVELASGELPLLAPMSRIAGRMAVQAGAYFLEAAHGGKGILLGGIPGVSMATVVVLGAGTSGWHAIDVAVGMGAKVTVLDISLPKLASVESFWGGRVETLFSTRHTVSQAVAGADLVIGAVLVAGRRAPVVVDAAQVRSMAPGSVLVDISIDQGGCFETSRETTHEDPVYSVDGVLHYAVGNIPGAVPRTSTFALTNATLRYTVDLAGGLAHAAARHPELVAGINVAGGEVTNPVVADTLGMAYTPADQIVR